MQHGMSKLSAGSGWGMRSLLAWTVLAAGLSGSTLAPVGWAVARMDGA
ncbi:hypothetical protein HNQ52_002193, partial [Chiayiivirga flava]|nr:hypothetical protein [Chiayiivirga flava]